MTHPTVFPTLRYADAPRAIDWLVDVLGAERHAVHANDDGTIAHAEVAFGNGIVMLGSARNGAPPSRGSIYVVVDDPDARYERARAAGAEVVRELQDTDYGSREFGVRDLEGHVWHFGTYQPFDA
jgi:uncharacterized glyoxalase superfamily protein PhnB